MGVSAIMGQRLQLTFPRPSCFDSVRSWANICTKGPRVSGTPNASGWSAGGHLTAAMADHPFFRGGLPISGIFDLEPIALNYLNEKLSLDAIEIATLSPIRTLSNKRPLRLAVPELKRERVWKSQACPSTRSVAALTHAGAAHIKPNAGKKLYGPLEPESHESPSPC